MSNSQSSRAQPTADPDLSGRRLGDYQLLRRLGRGGMAVVYLAEQLALNRQVAFKVLKGHLAKDESYVRRFVNEARSAASLVHGSIVQIHEVGCVEGIHFIAQEYVKGQNLKQFLERNGAVDAAMAVNIMRQVAAALHKAGEQGVIHRDIKPENIMLSANGEVKVADFGLARAIDGDVDLTQVGMTMGTPLYMSPEQCEGRTVDQRSDIYSFGVTSYHMLAGHPPFDGDSPISVAVQHLKKEPQRLEELRPDLPIGLCCIVHNLMAKDPSDRFQHAAEILHELRALPLEGLEEGWPSGMDYWDSTELATLTGSRLEATQKLAAVMKTEAIHVQRNRKNWPWVVATIAIALMCGVLLAWATRPKPLLSESLQKPAVPNKGSAQEQYRYATWVQTEDAWKSVETLFPLNDELNSEQRSQRQLYHRLSKQRLAEFYLKNGNDDAAMSIFAELAELEETAVKFRAFGIAGQAFVYWRREEWDLMSQKLNEVYEYRSELNQNMRNLVDRLNSQRGQQRDSRSDRSNR